VIIGGYQPDYHPCLFPLTVVRFPEYTYFLASGKHKNIFLSYLFSDKIRIRRI